MHTIKEKACDQRHKLVLIDQNLSIPDSNRLQRGIVMHTGFFFSDPWNSESAASNSKPLTVCYLCDTTAWFRHTVLYTIWKQLQPRSTELFAQPEQPFLCSSIYVPSSNLLFTAAESDLRSFSSCPALHTHWISLHSWMQPAILQQHQAVLQYSWK